MKFGKKFFSPDGTQSVYTIPLSLTDLQNGQMKFSINGQNDVRIVSTDYTNYVIWYNCGVSSDGKSFERVEVALRSSSSISPKIMNTIIGKLNSIGFNICEVGFVGRSKCPSF